MIASTMNILDFIQSCVSEASQQCVLHSIPCWDTIIRRIYPILEQTRIELMKNARCTQHPLLDLCGVSCHHHLHLPTDVAAALRTFTVQQLVEQQKTWPEFLRLTSGIESDKCIVICTDQSELGKTAIIEGRLLSSSAEVQLYAIRQDSEVYEQFLHK